MRSNIPYAEIDVVGSGAIAFGNPANDAKEPVVSAVEGGIESKGMVEESAEGSRSEAE